MEENRNLDMDELIDALSERLSEQLEEILENAVADQIEDAVMCAVQDVFDEALHSSLSRFEFVLENGTVVRPRQLMRVVSPDKSRMLLCYGGLRVDGQSLQVQTGAVIWQEIAYYATREQAIEALQKVKDAMMADAPICEL
jgi:hypothetical protein